MRAISLASGGIEVSIVMPCLNEAETVGECVDGAWQGLRDHGIAGEVIVVDNGSSDGSPTIARAHGARVVEVPERGYGRALMAGIERAEGRYIVMADADLSYDLREAPTFVRTLREGYDLVQGCRLPGGGGTVEPGAMPVLHRWWGNPMFSWMARTWFGTPIHDVHCGMRGFTRSLYDRLGQRCVGMEFASENVVKAGLLGARMTEIPITLYRDGRTAHAPHLQTFRDGWRHLRFYLLYSPRWLFLLPGVTAVVAGIIGYAVAMPRLTISAITFDVHTLLFASLAILCGVQSIAFAGLTKLFAVREGLLPPDARMEAIGRVITLERALVASSVAMCAGMALLLSAVWQWRAASFGALDYGTTMRSVIPGVTLSAIGVQGILSSFFAGILSLGRR